jgi:hypothetical protein
VTSGDRPEADAGPAEFDLRLTRLMPRIARSFPLRMLLSFKLVTRAFEALIALQAGFDRGWPLALAALGFAVLDCLLAPVLSGPGRRMLPRTALDAADVAFWSLALPAAGDVAVIAASPLILEAGLWYGARGLVMPVVIGGAATAASAVSAAGGRFTLLTLLWPAFAALGGRLVRGYLLSRWRQEARVTRHHLEAAISQAELAGQNSVAMGADSVVDLLVRTAPLIAQYEPAPIPAPFSGWKATLAEVCGRQSTYLGVALLRWQRLYNARSPDLSADIELRISPGAGTLLLSPGQARRLEALLDATGLSGVVPIDVPHLGPPGQQQEVVVGGRPLTIPADPRPRTWPITAAPIAFGAGAVIVLIQSVPQWEAVPLWLTGPLALLNLFAAWWSHRNAGRDPGELAVRVITVALLLGALQAVVTSVAMRTGSGRLPFLFFLHWALPLVYLHLRDLRRSRLPFVAMGLAAAVGAGVAAMPVSFSVVGAVVGSFWFAPPLLTVIGIRDILDQDVEDMRVHRGRMHDLAVRDGFRRGRLLIVDLTSDAVDQLRGRYRALGNAVPHHMGEEIERRLEEAGTMLAAAASD